MFRVTMVTLLAAGCAPAPTLKVVQSEVFAASCNFSSCHRAAGAGGLNLEAPTAAKLVNVKAVGAPSLVLVVPGQPEASYLYLKLTQATPAAGAQMPSNGDALSAERLALVHDWIAAGAKDD
jgi:mono/diheme cytochrome c family protein